VRSSSRGWRPWRPAWKAGTSCSTIERANTFELAINLKTAKALNLAVPASLRTQADHLIE
jgi:hypothetical protein